MKLYIQHRYDGNGMLVEMIYYRMAKMVESVLEFSEPSYRIRLKYIGASARAERITEKLIAGRWEEYHPDRFLQEVSQARMVG